MFLTCNSTRSNIAAVNLAKVRQLSSNEMRFPTPRTVAFASPFAILRLRSGQALRKDERYKMDVFDEHSESKNERLGGPFPWA